MPTRILTAALLTPLAIVAVWGSLLVASVNLPNAAPANAPVASR